MGHTIDIFAFQPSWDSLDSAELQYRRVRNAKETINELDRLPEPDFLLSGTSEEADEDGLMWGWAQEHQIPNMAFLDSWVNYSMRFKSSESEGSLDLLPQYVAAMDDIARTRLVEAGCPEEKILITGSPAFDAWPSLTKEMGEPWRRSILEPGEKVIISFAMEVLREYFGDDPGSETYLGYTEEDALNIAMKTISKLAETLECRTVLAVAPYPGHQEAEEVRMMVDSISAANDLSGKWMRTVVLDHHDRHEMVAGSDVVVGMISILLYESSLANVPVVSIQPNRRYPNDVTDLHPDINVTTNEQATLDAIRSALDSPRKIGESNGQCKSRISATETLADTITSLIG